MLFSCGVYGGMLFSLEIFKEESDDSSLAFLESVLRDHDVAVSAVISHDDCTKEWEHTDEPLDDGDDREVEDDVNHDHATEQNDQASFDEILPLIDSLSLTTALANQLVTIRLSVLV